MRDKIDERNFREKIAKSIIKSYNVHYISQEDMEQKRREEEQQKVREIVKMLNAEKAAKEEAQIREIERLRQEVEEKQKELEERDAKES